MSKISLVPQEMRPAKTWNIGAHLQAYRERTQKPVAVPLEELADPERTPQQLRAVVAEKARLATYTPEETENIQQLYPPETAASILKPQYTLRERLRFLPRPLQILIAVLLPFVVTWGLVAIFHSGAEITAPVDNGFQAGSDLAANESAGVDIAPAAKDKPQVVAAPNIFVHIVGEVNNPGVYEMEAGSRVSDAIAAAGGSTHLAVLERVNLARTVTDGEQILVPNSEQLADLSMRELGSVAVHDTVVAQRVNLNTAGAAELMGLPKIGAVTAQNIIAWRKTHGKFERVEQLLEVSGIGEKTLEALRDMVTI